MRYIGLDVHKDNITACVLTSTGKPKFEKNFIKDSESWNLDDQARKAILQPSGPPIVNCVGIAG